MLEKLHDKNQRKTVKKWENLRNNDFRQNLPCFFVVTQNLKFLKIFLSGIKGLKNVVQDFSLVFSL